MLLFYLTSSLFLRYDGKPIRIEDIKQVFDNLIYKRRIIMIKTVMAPAMVIIDDNNRHACWKFDNFNLMELSAKRRIIKFQSRGFELYSSHYGLFCTNKICFSAHFFGMKCN